MLIGRSRTKPSHIEVTAWQCVKDEEQAFQTRRSWKAFQTLPGFLFFNREQAESFGFFLLFSIQILPVSSDSNKTWLWICVEHSRKYAHKHFGSPLFRFSSRRLCSFSIFPEPVGSVELIDTQSGPRGEVPFFVRILVSTCALFTTDPKHFSAPADKAKWILMCRS